ncbi:hypothetical protein [Kaistia nematophila]|uniref:Uncharacterized protein n=1 Tax=Kaistia nematophila TaxID=2994654 RepID=A0A9X3EB79_9HYPH|nr:hypothetical protein [Kaistia nematophila]MCX5569590.1 hypothetical protein [Kaistia nematophila]
MIFCPPPFMGQSKQLVLIDRTTGTNRGSMTGAGGLAASFNGTTSETYANASRFSASSTTGWVGKTLSTSRVIGKVTTFGTNNSGYGGGTSFTTGGTFTMYLYAKNGTAPSAYNDGTVLGSASITSITNESTGRDISSSDLTTVWDHVWVSLVGGSAGFGSVGELQLYAWE